MIKLSIWLVFIPFMEEATLLCGLRSVYNMNRLPSRYLSQTMISHSSNQRPHNSLMIADDSFSRIVSLTSISLTLLFTPPIYELSTNWWLIERAMQTSNYNGSSIYERFQFENREVENVINYCMINNCFILT